MKKEEEITDPFWNDLVKWKELHPRDKCEFCDGTRGVYGNENVTSDGKIICDYCHSEGKDKE